MLHRLLTPGLEEKDKAAANAIFQSAEKAGFSSAQQVRRGRLRTALERRKHGSWGFQSK